MGMFDNLPGGAGGDWAKQAAEAQAMAEQAMKDAGYGSVANAAAAAPQMAEDRSAIEAQAREQNRILTVGSPAKITIVGKTDLGRNVAGNGTYLLELSVVPEGGEAYTVEKEEIIPGQVLSGYADGTTLDGRIDPADRNKVAFGDKPFM